MLWLVSRQGIVDFEVWVDLNQVIELFFDEDIILGLVREQESDLDTIVS